MAAVPSTESTAPAEPTTRPLRRGLGAVLLAALANLAVLGAWLLLGQALMGLLSIPRRIAMNSEWAFDTGRLPQPWWIAVAVVAIVVAHLFYRWAMGRLTGGRPAYWEAAPALLGLFGGVLYGAYYWYRFLPPVQVGRKVGPKAGQSTPWGPLGYVAYYAFAWITAVVALATAWVWVIGRRTPFAAFRRWRAARPPRVRRRRVRAAAAH